MDIMEMATQAGLQVLLDARIGSVTYHSVSGSVQALQRFADAVRATTLAESFKAGKSRNHRNHLKRPIPRDAAVHARQARRRAFLCRRSTTTVRRPATTFRARA